MARPKRQSATTKQGRRLADFPYAGAALAGLAVLLGIVLIRVLLVGPSNQRASAHARATIAAAYLEIVNSRTELLASQVARVAGTALVRDAILGRDPARRQQAAAVAQSLIDHVLGVRVYAAGEAAVDLAAEPPVRFAALDLVRSAEAGESKPLEAHFDDGRLLIYSAAPVRDGDRIVGSVLVTTDGSYLEAALAAVDLQDGGLRLEQRFPSLEPVTLLALGRTGDGAGDTLRQSTRLPHWFLEYTPSDVINRGGGILGWSLLPILAIALVGIAGGFFLGFYRQYRQLEADGDALVNALPRMFAGQGPFPVLALRFMDRLARAIADLGPAAMLAATRARDATGTAAAAGGAAPGAADEVTLDVDLAAADSSEAAGLDIEVVEDADASTDLTAAARDAGLSVLSIDPEIFRAYDIRGIVDDNLGPDVVEAIGRAIGSEAATLGVTRIAVGGDGRHSSPALRQAVIRGITQAGVNVIDIGEVPTPVLYFAAHALETGSGVMITGSHNPPEYNGIKMMLAYETLAGERIQGLRQRVERDDFTTGRGTVETLDIVDRYVDRIANDVAVAQPLRVVVDCGNGVAGKVAPAVLRALGCEVIELYCDVDGDFPNHHPDPAVADNLKDLIRAVQGERAHLGVAFDGDGDRLGVVDNTGRIIWPDRVLMLFARDIVGRNPGSDVIYDVKCSRHLNSVITEFGGRPIMWKTGHSHIKAKIRETGALLGGEFSGHICFAERWYGFDDGIYSAARLLEIVAATAQTSSELFAEFPDSVSTPELKVTTTDAHKFEVLERLAQDGNFEGGSLNTIDGIRVDFADGWGLVRASNTSPVLTLRFEADNDAALTRIRDLFRRELARCDATLKF
jgi:phosphomannomutase/phosphoglucomutase